MTRWTWAALAVVTVAGVATGWYSAKLQHYNLDGLPARKLDWRLLPLSALPTGLLLAASAIRRRSATMQVTVAVVAAAVALGRVSVIRGELATPWGHGTGLISGLAWGAGVVAASVLLLAAGVSEVSELIGRHRAAHPVDQPLSLPGSLNNTGAN